MNILITGYTGFIGSNLTKALHEYRLTGIDILNNGSVSKHFNWDQLDQCRNIDCIIHLAGKAHDTSRTTCEDEYFEVNLGLTQKIFDWFLQSDAEKFIFFSSVKAVADSVIGESLTEEVVPEPNTPYGRSKFAAERYILEKLRDFERTGKEHIENQRSSLFDKAQGKINNLQSGIPLSPAFRSMLTSQSSKQEKKVYILRPCMIHGPGNKGNLNLLYKMVVKGIPWPLGASVNMRSFVSIDNLIFVISKLIAGNIEPGIYQVADDEPVSTNQLIILIGESLDKKSLILKIPVSLIRFAARLGDFLKLPLNSERLKKLTESYVVSNNKLKKALGVSEMPILATDGIRKTLRSFRAIR